MRSTTISNNLFISVFIRYSFALPGLRTASSIDCHATQNSNTPLTCVEASSIIEETTLATNVNAHTVTPGPILIAQPRQRDVDEQTAVCSHDTCYVYDVSSSLLTVITLPDATSSARPPYGNGTTTSHPHGTGTGHISATPNGYSSQSSNDTTVTISKTVSVLTVTAPAPMPWHVNTSATRTGTGAQPFNPLNATRGPLSWSVWRPLPTNGPGETSIMRANPTPTLEGQNYTGSAPQFTAAPSYITTKTFVFSDTTIVIPIPAGYASSLTPDATTQGLSSSTSSYETSGRITSSLSTSSCWTTQALSTSGNRIVTVNATNICWLLECDDHNSCTDHISRYPVTVDALSTSASALPSNDTTTTTSNSGIASVTDSSRTPSPFMWAPWPTSRNSSSSTPSSLQPQTVPSSSTISIDSTVTRTVVPVPQSSPKSSFWIFDASANRRSFINGRSQDKAADEGQEKRNK